MRCGPYTNISDVIVHFDSLDTPRAISFRAKLDAGDA